MGFYLRSNLRAGPFRLNLSRSGIGVSAGVPGFRVGTGPRGNYVRVGGRGIYYAGTAQRTPALKALPQTWQALPPAPPPAGEVELQELAGASVQQLVAANPTEIITQMRDAARRIRIWPIATAVLALLALFTVPYGLILLLPGIPGVLWLRQRGRARRSVVVFYQVDDEPAVRFDHLAAAHHFTRQAQRAWHVEARGDLTTPYQRKVNAGASSVIRRSAATLTVDGPPVLVTNIAVPSLNTRNRSVYFLPDRALVRQGKDYAELPYVSLHVSVTPQRFIEDGPTPTDSQMVDTTWQYANVNGGPDRRFKNNRQLPVMLYGRLTLSNPYGFLMVWDFSRPDVAVALAEAIRRMT
jgi:DNA polymerase-3 subunit epsilon